MGPLYLFALVVGLGVLVAQLVMGGKDADQGHDAAGDADHDAGQADAHSDAHGAGAHHEVGGGFEAMVALLASTRFWIFAAFAFGLSGALLHYVFDGGAIATLATALALGLGSGFGAALAFRTLAQSSGAPVAGLRQAVGRVGRVVVPLAPGAPGKIRIELQGQSVDVLARTAGDAIARGEPVVIEEIDGESALVSRAPDELR